VLSACILHKNRALAVAKFSPPHKAGAATLQHQPDFGAIKGDALEATLLAYDSIAPIPNLPLLASERGNWV
jgi:hypothetical protein